MHFSDLKHATFFFFFFFCKHPVIVACSCQWSETGISKLSLNLDTKMYRLWKFLISTVKKNPPFWYWALGTLKNENFIEKVRKPSTVINLCSWQWHVLCLACQISNSNALSKWLITHYKASLYITRLNFSWKKHYMEEVQEEESGPGSTLTADDNNILITLAVSLDQEVAIRTFFQVNDWPLIEGGMYCKHREVTSTR